MTFPNFPLPNVRNPFIGPCSNHRKLWSRSNPSSGGSAPEATQHFGLPAKFNEAELQPLELLLPYSPDLMALIDEVREAVNKAHSNV